MTLIIMALIIMTLRKTTLCRNVECSCAECRVLFIIMLNVIMLSVVILSIVTPLKQSRVMIMAATAGSLQIRPGVYYIDFVRVCHNVTARIRINPFHNLFLKKIVKLFLGFLVIPLFEIELKRFVPSTD